MTDPDFNAFGFAIMFEESEEGNEDWRAVSWMECECTWHWEIEEDSKLADVIEMAYGHMIDGCP